MALPIKLEAHQNTNIPQYFGFVTSNPLSSYRGNYNNGLFLHGIRHPPRGELPTTDALQSFPQTIGAQMN